MHVRLIHNEAERLETDLAYFEEVLEELQFQYSKPPELHSKGGYSLFFDCSFEEVEKFIQSVANRGFRPAL